MEQTNSTLRDQIDAIGGINAVAALLGIKAPSVHSWLYANRVPPARLKIFQILFPLVFAPTGVLVGASRRDADTLEIDANRVIEYMHRREVTTPDCAHLARLRELYPEAGSVFAAPPWEIGSNQSLPPPPRMCVPS